MTSARLLPFALLALLPACAATREDTPPPLGGGEPADHLIQPGEEHFRHLWKLTSGGENAEGYWSYAGDRFSYQRRNPEEGLDCDQIFVTDENGESTLVSTGKGVTTCAHFMPGDFQVIYASTHADMPGCPPPADFSQGYVWRLHPEYDLWVTDLRTGERSRLTDEPGYDAEATVSPRGDRIVFTSTRSGDSELWTMALDGSDVRQVTDTVGYDGGAFFSHDGKRLVFRTTAFTPGAEEEEHATYRSLIAENKVRPHSMELMLIDVDGGNRTQLTHLGAAAFAPFFFPDDSRVIFSSNHGDEGGRNFDLWAIDADGGNLERITTYESFDSFPMFSADGRWLLFGSNRGGAPGETNMFLAEWR